MEEIQSFISNTNTSNIQLVVGINDLKELCFHFVKEAFDQQKKLKEQENDGLLDSMQVKELLKVKDGTLWKWNKRGYLRHVKIGSRNYYKREDVDKILGKKGNKGGSEKKD